jgi:hypothetical protein
MIEILLGGLIGAVIASVLVIIYEEIKYARNVRRDVAKEKLEKLYSPLFFFLKNSKNISGKKDEDGFLHSKEEGELIDKIVFNYYYLADDDLRNNIFLLYSSSRYKGGNKEIFNDIFSKIRQGYERYRKELGMS